MDHTGDGETGDVIYQSGAKTMRAPYAMDRPKGKAASATIQHDKAKAVKPLVTYQVESQAPNASGNDGTQTRRGSDRTTQPNGSDGSGNPSEDPTRAPHVRISASQESDVPRKHLELSLVESSSNFVDELQIRESRTDYPIKLISPGTGSSAHYPAEVLKRDGPKIFTPGTLMFWNHPTAAEEAARPEGDLSNLAAILTKPAVWNESGKHGPGLYAEAKVMADYAQRIEERAPHIGLSIRAGGTGTGKTINGKPELASLDYAESVDYVTRAGRGGMALAEAARDAGILPQEETMDQAGIDKLVEAALAKALPTAVAEAMKAAPVPQPVLALQERALRGDAMVEANRCLADVTLPAASKQRVIDTVLRETLPKTATGELDATKFAEIVAAEAKREGSYISSLTGGVRVTGMGPIAEPDPKLREAEIAREKEAEAGMVKVFLDMGMPLKAAEAAAKGRAA